MFTNKTQGYLCAILLLSILLSAINAVAGTNDFRHRAHQIDNTANLDFSTADNIKAEIRFGRSVAARVLGREPLYNHERLARYVTLVGRTVALYSARPELDFHFAILDSDTINAYSTPGGYVFVTLGAIKQMQDEAELAAVLAHEIAHINQRHIVKELNIRAADKSLVSGLSTLVGGSADITRTAFLQAIDQAVSLLFDKGFSKRDELDADHTATLLLAIAGYDPLALQRYLGHIEKITKDQPQAIHTTHPPSHNRGMALGQTIASENLSQSGYPNLKERFHDHVHAN